MVGSGRGHTGLIGYDDLSDLVVAEYSVTALPLLVLVLLDSGPFGEDYMHISICNI